MGRRNKTWKQVYTMTVQLEAINQEEAGRIAEDVRDGLIARFSGAEIFPPRIKGESSRFKGRPVFRSFILKDRPQEISAFDDE